MKKIIPFPTLNEQETCLSKLQTLHPRSSVLTAVYRQESTTPLTSAASVHLPATILSYFDPKYIQLSPSQLKIESRHVFKEELTVTPTEAKFLSESTILQSLSLVWHEHRKGPLTASQFGSICHTNFTSPSSTLVSSILNRQKFSSPALKWGLDNEATAKEAYYTKMSELHSQFSIHSCGLQINTLYPHLGASPDGIISCLCCGDGLVEVKCPYSIRDESPTTTEKANFYLKPLPDGGRALSKSHNYYYQVQGQLIILNLPFCDFVCWTPNGMHVERIERDDMFCEAMLSTLETFFVDEVLPATCSDWPIARPE